MRTKSAQRKGWRDTQKHYKFKKTTKLALFVIGLLLLLLIFGQVVRLFNNLTSSWGIEGGKKNYTWDGNSVVNLVVKNNSTFFLSYNPKEGEMTIINFPDNLQLEVPKGFGSWQMRAIYNLGETNKQGEGALLLKESVSLALGLPVDGVLIFEEVGSGDAKALIESFRKDINIFNTLKNIKTDLTLWELIRLKMALSNVRFDKVSSIDLESQAFLVSKTLADGTAVFEADPVKLDSITTELFDPIVKQEYKSIVIFNATDKALLAQNASRMISNLGGNVITVANSDVKVAKTYLLGDLTSQTYKRLLQIFDTGCSQDKKCDKIPAENLGVNSARADIVVVLGEDFF